MALRGRMTPSLQVFMEGWLGRPTTLAELHLIPYLQFVMVNDQRLDPKKINDEERGILSLLRAAGHIEGGATGFKMTRAYWDFCCEVLWRSYVEGEVAA